MNKYIQLFFGLIVISMLAFLCYRVENIVKIEEKPVYITVLDTTEIVRLNKEIVKKNRKIKNLKYQIREDDRNIKFWQENYQKAKDMAQR